MRNLLRCALALGSLWLAVPSLAQTPPPPPPPPPPVGAPAPVNPHWRDAKATLSGTITDETGAKLKNASLSFTNRFTGTRVDTRANHAGQYRVSLQLGVYTVQVQRRHLMPLTSEITLTDDMQKDFVVGGPASEADSQTPR